MANGKPWYRINLNLRRRLREFKKNQQIRREKRERERMNIHDRIPEEATGVYSALQRGMRSPGPGTGGRP